MLRNHIYFSHIVVNRTTFVKLKRFVTTLTPRKITELLKKHEVNLAKDVLPSYIKSIECNQLASNNPIEDRLRVSALHLPGLNEPTFVLGVFDGHGGGTTADLISRRLFNYIALSLHPEPKKLEISNYGELKNIVVDLHNSPLPIVDPILQAAEIKSLSYYKQKLPAGANIAANLSSAFKSCDDDLSREIQENLTSIRSSHSILNYYLSAAVSGCCALVMVIHQGIGYLASAGDCRAVLGIHNSNNKDNYQQQDNSKKDANQIKEAPQLNHKFSAIELNDEHNCDNINEIRRLTASHPITEQNTMIRHNRLLGHLMPFRAFGDFNYKWPADIIKACGITRAFGSGVIPSNYKTPPYLIVEPDVKEIAIGHGEAGSVRSDEHRCVVIASDGLWELFESSREAIETIVDHSINASQQGATMGDYDENSATHLLRSALRSGSHQDFGADAEELRRLYHIRLESTLTLPQSVVRNFRDDISIIVLKLE